MLTLACHPLWASGDRLAVSSVFNQASTLRPVVSSASL